MTRLIILSDLWGGECPNWLQQYLNILSPHFDLHYYDSRQLAEISSTINAETHLHQAFLNGGINTAVQNLINNERKELIVLGFSIGGAIAWKAVVAGLNAKLFFAVSSTRLRYETEKLNTKVKLYYGRHDKFKPTINQLNTLAVDYIILENREHDLYKNHEIALSISNEIIHSWQIGFDQEFQNEE